MAGIALQTRMEHAQHFRAGREPARHIEAGLLVMGEADRKRPQTAQGQKHIVGACANA